MGDWKERVEWDWVTFLLPSLQGCWRLVYLSTQSQLYEATLDIPIANCMFPSPSLHSSLSLSHSPSVSLCIPGTIPPVLIPSGPREVASSPKRILQNSILSDSPHLAHPFSTNSFSKPSSSDPLCVFFFMPGLWIYVYHSTVASLKFRKYNSLLILLLSV